MNIDRRLYTKPHPPRTPAEKIEISYSKPEKSEEIGELTVQFNKGYAREKIMGRLKDEAAEAGADGFILKRFRRNDNSWVLGGRQGERGNSFSNSHYRWTVIMYRYQQAPPHSKR